MPSLFELGVGFGLHGVLFVLELGDVSLHFYLGHSYMVSHGLQILIHSLELFYVFTPISFHLLVLLITVLFCLLD